MKPLELLESKDHPFWFVPEVVPAPGSLSQTPNTSVIVYTLLL
jgi:hypothetical protein